ncbi:MAG: hypothetical protein OEU26_12390, partial [Candidatus Tectomicrobia bacterium]|nr:hypothetical protein [Candidatus Tectomicrobia bacterium]
MIGLIVKAVLGALLFTFILWLAQSRNPRVAGMMLTFPALNGIGLLTGERQEVSLMAHAMMPMIVTNGLLCAGYVWVHPRLGRAGFVPLRVQAVGLMVVCLLLWGLAASILAAPLESWLMVSGSMWIAAFGYVLLAGPLMWGLWRPAQAHDLLRQSWWQVVRANVERVAGLVGLLVLVMLCVRFGATTWAGRLSALP